MLVAEAVGRALAACGVRTAFGLVGSGNFHLTNADRRRHPVVGSAHEAGPPPWPTRTRGFRRGERCRCTRPGVTNALTGITEAAKSRTRWWWRRRGDRAGSTFLDLAGRGRGRRRLPAVRCAGVRGRGRGVRAAQPRAPRWYWPAVGRRREAPGGEVPALRPPRWGGSRYRPPTRYTPWRSGCAQPAGRSSSPAAAPPAAPTRPPRWTAPRTGAGPAAVPPPRGASATRGT